MRVIANFVLTDGGRGKSPAHSFERLDCTVRALSNSTGLGYDWAHKHMERSGRKPGHRAAIGRALRDLPWVTEVRVRRQRVSTLLSSCRTGSWIVGISGHVFALVAGEQLDMARNDKCIVKRLWRIDRDKLPGAPAQEKIMFDNQTLTIEGAEANLASLFQGLTGAVVERSTDPYRDRRDCLNISMRGGKSFRVYRSTPGIACRWGLEVMA